MNMGEAKPRVALVKGDERYPNVWKALQSIEEDIGLDGVQTILIKPNFTSVTRQSAATHVDATRAVLDFLRQRTSAQIIIGEGSGSFLGSTKLGFKNFGYLTLGEQYDLKLIDLNSDEPVTTEIFDYKLRPLTIRLAKTAVAADYRISISPPKTHDCVVVTAALKNMVMGSVVRKGNRAVNKLFAIGQRLRQSSSVPFSGKMATWLGHLSGDDKMKVHQGHAVMNLNLYKMARVVPPQLSVIDGFQGMEGEGPADGEPVDLGIAIASTDFVAADSLAAALMGFEPKEIGYLFYCWQKGLGEIDISKMSIIGERVESCIRPFKPHPTHEAQLRWQMIDAERYLE
jgi:uncharacterized protein (DUF362 family)